MKVEYELDPWDVDPEKQGAPERVWARVPGLRTGSGVQFGDYVCQPIEGFVEYVHIDQYTKLLEVLTTLRHHLQKQPDVARLIDAALSSRNN